MSIEGIVEDARRAAIEAFVRDRGGSAVWRSSPTAGRSYALVALPDGDAGAAMPEAAGETLYEAPIIALAVFPAAAEALPALCEALGGAGAPAGILAQRPCRGGLVVEFDPNATSPQVVLALIDVELRRWGGGRRVEVLSPLASDVALRIAAGGLRAPEIGSHRVLELLLERHGV